MDGEGDKEAAGAARYGQRPNTLMVTEEDFLKAYCGRDFVKGGAFLLQLLTNSRNVDIILTSSSCGLLSAQFCRLVQTGPTAF